MALKKSPCFGCEDGTSECHAKCPKYAEFAKDRQEHLTLVWKVKKTKRALDDVKAGCVKSCTHGKIKRSARRKKLSSMKRTRVETKRFLPFTLQDIPP